MADQRDDDRQRIGEQEGGQQVDRGARQQHEQRRAGTGEIQRGDADLRQSLRRSRQRYAPRAPADPLSGPQRAQQDQPQRPRHHRTAQPADDALAKDQGLDGDRPLMEQQPQSGDGEHAEPEGRAGDGDDPRDIRPVQPGGGVDAVARRSAGQQPQPQIVAERVTGEGRRRRRPPAQGPPDDAQRDHVVECQRDIARDGEADRHHDLARVDGVEGGADVAQANRPGQVMQRRQAERDEQQDRARRQITAPRLGIGKDPIDHRRQLGMRRHRAAHLAIVMIRPPVISAPLASISLVFGPQICRPDSGIEASPPPPPYGAMTSSSSTLPAIHDISVMLRPPFPQVVSAKTEA